MESYRAGVYAVVNVDRAEPPLMFLNHLYNGMDEPEFKIVNVFMCKLRKKLSAATGGEIYIETVWGRGYVLRDPNFSDQAAA